MANPKASRGYRNRNPGNIDHNPANKWQGLDVPPIEPVPPGGGRARFCRFVSHEFGIRALATLLITYQDRHKLRTVRGIINRWAPGNENDTDAYVQAVARKIGVADDEVLDLQTYPHLRPLVEAIISHELGGNPYDGATIDAGLRLAGVPPPVTTMREAAATPVGRGAIEAAGVTGAVAVAVQAAPALTSLSGLDWRVGIAVVALAAIAIVAFVLLRRKRAP
jgi:hypothetical protein